MSYPKYLYHATYKQFLKSILEKGLGNTRRKMWSDSKSGVVYLAADPEVAYSYAEAADWLEDREDEDIYINNIIVLKIDSSTLDKKLLSIDSNVLDNAGDTLEYLGIITKNSIVDIVDESGQSLVKYKKLLEDYSSDIFYSLEIKGRGGFFRNCQLIIDQATSSTSSDDEHNLGLKLDGLLTQLIGSLQAAYPKDMAETSHFAYTQAEYNKLCRLPSYYDSEISVIQDLKETLAELGYELEVKTVYPKKISGRDEQQIVYEQLQEATRAQLIAKSKNVGNYKNQAYGKNRFERKKLSKLANNTKQYNQIDMNKLFKQDSLEIKIPVIGETDTYNVTIRLDGVIQEAQKKIKANNNIFEYKIILQSLIKTFNTGDVYVNCSCPDFKYSYDHWSVVNKTGTTDSAHDPGPGKGIRNPNDDKGIGCKHALLVLSNQDWIMKVTSVIVNYINYINEKLPDAFNKLILPKLYGVSVDDLVDKNLVPEDFELDSKTSIIDEINEYAKNRGKFKKGSNINPVYANKLEKEQNK